MDTVIPEPGEARRTGADATRLSHLTGRYLP
jgi:hypothetical protein